MAGDKSERPRCAKRVYSGQRWDMAGHRCGNAAAEGSEFCHLHGGGPAEDPTGPATAPPEVSSRQETTYFAAMERQAGTGPVVKVPYRSGHGFVTRAMAKAAGGWGPEVSVVGVMRRKDGTPGEQRWEGSPLNARKLLGDELTSALLSALEEERSR